MTMMTKEFILKRIQEQGEYMKELDHKYGFSSSNPRYQELYQSALGQSVYFTGKALDAGITPFELIKSAWNIK